MSNKDIQGFVIDSQGYIFAGTWGSGVFRSIETTTSVNDLSGEIPATFLLEQNYPNPFNPSTAISYQLSTVSDVELGIYNMSGQHIKTLVKRRQSAGRYRIQWDGTDDAGMRVASGVYLMTLRAGEFVQARKLTLMK